MKKIYLLTVLVTLVMMLGCSNTAQTGGLIGAGIGAAGGAAIDHNNRGRGAILGGMIGGAGGYIAGNEISPK